MSVSLARTRKARLGRVGAAGGLLVMVACGVGCLTLESTIKPDGSATFEMTYATSPTSAEAEKKRFSSDHVTVDSLTFANPTSAMVKAHVDDITKASTAEGFKNVTVTRATENGDVRLTIVFKNPVPATLKDEGKPGPKVTLHLPGAVKEANHDAKVAGDTVTWSFSFVDWMKEKSTTLEVRYAEAAKAAADAPHAAPKNAAEGEPGKAPAKH